MEVVTRLSSCRTGEQWPAVATFGEVNPLFLVCCRFSLSQVPILGEGVTTLEGGGHWPGLLARVLGNDAPLIGSLQIALKTVCWRGHHGQQSGHRLLLTGIRNI